MEFNEKIQLLRKQKELTQEELAEKLHVSRTAISKWESGRGYPNIDSLKQIAKLFSLTVDELLSAEELLNLAEDDTKKRQIQTCDLVFGLIDIAAAVLFFLPLFAQRENGEIYEVSLLYLSVVSPYIRVLFYTVVAASFAVGVLTLALQNFDTAFWNHIKHILSLSLTAIGTLLFILGLQPYAAILLFVFMIIKTFLLIKGK